MPARWIPPRRFIVDPDTATWVGNIGTRASMARGRLPVSWPRIRYRKKITMFRSSRCDREPTGRAKISGATKIERRFDSPHNAHAITCRRRKVIMNIVVVLSRRNPLHVR